LYGRKWSIEFTDALQNPIKNPRRIRMPSLGFPELIVIMVIVLLIFGAGKLPGIGEALGKGIRSFKKAVSDRDDENTASKNEQEKPKSP
jgi:sec-independent protein translocase protein TatA